jgi:hypothetical protein
MFADFASQGLPLIYTQRHAAHFRMRMLLSILDGFIKD